jgi:DNA-binding beta-propeller fold protein YncE
LAARRRPAARAVALAVAGATVAFAGGTACTGSTADPLQVADTFQPATPASSPPTSRIPFGQLIPLTAQATAAVVEPTTHNLAVAATGPDRLLLYDLNRLDAAPQTVVLPGAVDQLDVGAPGELLAPVRAANVLLRITPGPAGSTPDVRSLPVGGGPNAAAVSGRYTVVALADQGVVAVLDGERLLHTVPGFTGPADLVATGTRVAVLDRGRTAVTTIEPATGTLGPALRAGHGAANAVGDRFGRVLVTDTRDGELLAFGVDPLIMRQRYPVPGAPYGIAYDPARDLAWVTLTETNEVVGFDVAGGEPAQRYRLAALRQPNAVAVDPDSGTVVVVSGSGEGIQVVRP